jgi:hypothetical protein
MRITLASPVEPSGASWLINCFLELGIKVSHKPVVDNVWRHIDPTPPPDHIWQRAACGGYRLHPKAQVLKQFLPVLSRVDVFRFDEDVEVEYVQDLPGAQHVGAPALLFVRDPRDSLYSMYRRVQPALDYEAFLRFPNPDTLSTRPTHWRLFVEAWIALAGENWFTFEEYKRDPAGLLQRVLERAHIARRADEIERAVVESSFERARAAEESYRTSASGEWEVVNRAGRVGDWIDRSEARPGSGVIERRAGSVMRRLGYDAFDHRDETSVLADEADGDDVCAFSCEMDESLLRHSNLPTYRIRQLLDNLESMALARGWASVERIAALREHFTEGSEHQFAQLRDLLRQRKRTTPQGA